MLLIISLSFGVILIIIFVLLVLGCESNDLFWDYPKNPPPPPNSDRNWNKLELSKKDKDKN